MDPSRTSPEPVDPGALLAATHELEDGSRVRLRLTRATDLEKIESFLEAANVDEPADRFAFHDPRERLTLAATMPSDGGEEIAGIAEVALRDAATAETGILVAGDFQGRGLGTLLSDAAASIAARRRNAA
jgi:GNAT superfamily N-acetyltransferase